MRSTDSLVKIGKWSDGEQWVTDRDKQAKSQKRLLLGRECDSVCEFGNLHAELSYTITEERETDR